MSVVQVEILTTTHTSQYGTLTQGDKLRTSAAFAAHLVDDCGAAKYVNDDVPAAPEVAAAEAQPAAAPRKPKPAPRKPVEASEPAVPVADVAGGTPSGSAEPADDAGAQDGAPAAEQ